MHAFPRVIKSEKCLHGVSIYICHCLRSPRYVVNGIAEGCLIHRKQVLCAQPGFCTKAMLTVSETQCLCARPDRSIFVFSENSKLQHSDNICT